MSLTQQQERFCQLIAQGKNQTDAYMEAGYKAKDAIVAKAAASRLFANVNIANRVQELRQSVAGEAEVTLKWLQDKAKELLIEAQAAGQYAAANGSLKELGILTGFRVEKSDRTNRTVEDTSDLTRDELYRIARGSREGTAAPGIGQGQLN
jgi:phage terminase small subunit